MELKYNTYIKDDAIKANLNKLINQIYKLLPTWEEALDWKKPLSTIIEEIAGMSRLFLDHHKIFFSLLCKLEGLFIYTNERDFFEFRRSIFECLSYMNELVRVCQ